MRATWVSRCAAGLILPVLWAPSVLAGEEEPDDEVNNPCRGELPADAGGLETVRAGVQRGVCSTARFVDRLFGGEHEYSEVGDETYGRAGLTLGWNEQDGTGIDGRFHASVALPALHERLNATIGRASDDEFIADEGAGLGPVGGSFSDDEPAEWFAGLGYSVHRDRDSRFDLGAGAKLDTPPNPYLNARYRHYIYANDGLLWTLRSTAFWENQQGFGVTQAFDVDRVLSHDYLLRWANTARFSEETEGVRWRSLWRDWLFIEMGGLLFWADGPLPADRCDACLGASIGFEILFGEAYDRALRREPRAQEAATETP